MKKRHGYLAAVSIGSLALVFIALLLAEDNSFQQRLIDLSAAAIKPINFYGRVIDQYGEPVVGVEITHVGHNAVYAAGSGHMRTLTDENGFFSTDGASGSALTIESLSKPGYEFTGRQHFSGHRSDREDDQVWRDYSKENPFIFKAWKVNNGVFPKISKARATYGFKLGKIYSMDLMTSDKRRVKKEGTLDLDLQVLFERDESAWRLVLAVPEGGLIETEDTFLNLAPESGYQKTLDYSGSNKDHMVPRKFYIHSRDKYFGRLLVEIRPYMRKGSGLGIDHVMNLDAGRNLEVEH